MISSGEPGSPNGQELLAEFMKYGHQRPFEEIVRRYAGMVFNVCLRITKDKHDAEDATQAVFLTLALQAKRGAEIKALGPWLQQVGKRLALDLRRSKSRRKTREERHHDEQTLRRRSSDNALLSADMDEIKTILHEELHKLPTKYRLPLILHYFGGLSRDEMAAELKCKPSTLGVRIFRGREMLAGRLNGRGITIASSTFAAVMAFIIKSAISESMVRSTSHAASALAGGHDGMGLVSNQVIGLTRRAGGAMMIGKVKVAAAVLMLACTTFGGAKAFGMLPYIDVQQIITTQMQRLIRPLMQPFTMPMRVDSTPAAPLPHPAPLIALVKPEPLIAPQPVAESATNWRIEPFVKPVTLAIASAPPPSAAPIIAPPMSIHLQSAPPAPASVLAVAKNTSQPANSSSALVTAAAAAPRSPSASMAAAPATAVAMSSSSSGTAVLKSTSSGGSHTAQSDSSIAVMAAVPATELVVPATPPDILASAGDSTGSGSSAIAIPVTGPGGTSTRIFPVISTASSGAFDGAMWSPSYIANNNTVVASSGSQATYPAATPSTPSPVVHLSTTDGNVTQTNGVITGWGHVAMAGTLDISGQIIAEGFGADHTLDLSGFRTVHNSADNPAVGGRNGLFARDHGKLTLAVQKSADGSAVTWGEDPSDPQIDLVNSVRLNATAAAGEAPLACMSQISLLAVDRTDAPSLAGIIGVPIGLWQIDPAVGSLPSADLTIRYNDALVSELGGAESGVNLWELSSGSWQTVDPSTFVLDTTDHLVSGVATDFNYFAVTVPAGPATDISQILAHASAEIAPVADTVPEPAALGIMAMAAGLLLQRRRRWGGATAELKMDATAKARSRKDKREESRPL